MEKGFDFQLSCCVYYPLLVVQVGSDEADERSTWIGKRNLQAGALVVLFLIPLVSRGECQKELENPGVLGFSVMGWFIWHQACWRQMGFTCLIEAKQF